MDALPEEAVIVAGLRAGDELMFTALVRAWSRNMLWLARSYVSTDGSAEEVLQDTWLAVLRGIGGFAGRATLKTWVYRILVNIAKRRGAGDSRMLPSGSMLDDEPPGRFQGESDPFPGHWKEFPQAWPSSEGGVLAGEARGRIVAALAELPPRQRAVIALRDLDGYTADEVCAILRISPGNQRVLLHRARAALRERVAEYFRGDTEEEP